MRAPSTVHRMEQHLLVIKVHYLGTVSLWDCNQDNEQTQMQNDIQCLYVCDEVMFDLADLIC